MKKMINEVSSSFLWIYEGEFPPVSGKSGGKSGVPPG